MEAPQLSHGGRPPLAGTAQDWLMTWAAVGPAAGVVVTRSPYVQEPTALRNTRTRVQDGRVLAARERRGSDIPDEVALT